MDHALASVAAFDRLRQPEMHSNPLVALALLMTSVRRSKKSIGRTIHIHEADPLGFDGRETDADSVVGHTFLSSHGMPQDSSDARIIKLRTVH